MDETGGLRYGRACGKLFAFAWNVLYETGGLRKSKINYSLLITYYSLLRTICSKFSSILSYFLVAPLASTAKLVIDERGELKYRFIALLMFSLVRTSSFVPEATNVLFNNNSRS